MSQIKTREREYRAYNTDLKEWIDMSNCLIKPDDGALVISDDQGGYIIPDFNYIIQEYIGMDDKMGNKIFENDILELEQCGELKHLVIFKEGAFCLCSTEPDSYGRFVMDIHYIQHGGKNTSKIINNAVNYYE